jgi:hypothetical protein
MSTRFMLDYAGRSISRRLTPAGSRRASHRGFTDVTIMYEGAVATGIR